MTDQLKAAAQAVIDAWDAYDGTAMEVATDALRATLAADAVPTEPLFLLHCGQIDSSGEQDDWDSEAMSHKAVERFAANYPGQTIPLYPHPAPQPAAERKPVSDLRKAQQPAQVQAVDTSDAPEPVSVRADECAANGDGHRFGPHGMNGEEQCEWCVEKRT